MQCYFVNTVSKKLKNIHKCRWIEVALQKTVILSKTILRKFDANSHVNGKSSFSDFMSEGISGNIFSSKNSSRLKILSAGMKP